MTPKGSIWCQPQKVFDIIAHLLNDETRLQNQQNTVRLDTAGTMQGFMVTISRIKRRGTMDRIIHRIYF